MMKSIKRRMLFSVLFFSSLALLLFFNNCSPTQISANLAQGEVDLSSTVEGEAVYYTNQKQVPVTVNSENLVIDQYRVSLTENMEQAGVQWQTWSRDKRVTQLDLGEQFASDGSRDGEKKVYVEARYSREPEKFFKSNLVIFLDTQVPAVDGLDFLTTGLNGQIFKKNQKVKIKFKLYDRLASSGVSSGINPNTGFRYGVSLTGDCSESSLIQKTSWGQPQDGTDIEWPEDDPLQAFYFCIYAKDRAGNINNYLSQPMTSMWFVYAGDNSQGNGASVTSNKVRFKTPGYLHFDTQNNLYIKDQDFANFRRVLDFQNDEARTIEKFEAAKVPNELVKFDSSGNGYYQSGSQIIKVDSKYENPQVLVTGVTLAKLAIRRFNGQESLLISHVKDHKADTALSLCYLFEIPLADLAKLTASLSLTDLISRYKIAGNGVNPYSSVTAFAPILTANDSADSQYSVGFAREVIALDDGEIILLTVRDGSGQNYGHHALRRLKPRAEGGFNQKVIEHRLLVWMFQAVHYKDKATTADSKNLLFISTAYGPLQYDLKTDLPTEVFPEIKDDYNIGVALKENVEGNDFDLYFSSSTKSQVFKYNKKLELVEVFGRKVFDGQITDALNFLIGDPDGLVQDPATKDLYVIDSQNGVINKVDENGKIEKIIGKVGENVQIKYYNNESFENVSFNTSGAVIGYTNQLAADFDSANQRKMIYMSQGGGKIDKIDLINKKVTSLYDLSRTLPTDEKIKYKWGVDSLYFIKSDTDSTNKLYVWRNWNVNNSRNNTWQTGLTSFIQEIGLNAANFDGQYKSQVGDIKKSLVTNEYQTAVVNPDLPLRESLALDTSTGHRLVFDSQGNQFMSGIELNILLKNSNTVRNIKNLGRINSFVLVEQDSLRHLIYILSKEIRILTIDLSLVPDTAKNPVVARSRKLCLPGGSVSNAKSMIIGHDGNIFISDSQNARVLKYLIRNQSDGSLKFNYCSP